MVNPQGAPQPGSSRPVLVQTRLSWPPVGAFPTPPGPSLLPPPGGPPASSPARARLRPCSRACQPQAKRRCSRRPLLQANLRGCAVSSADSNTYGHPLPPHGAPGASIFTFQNIGRQTASAYTAKSFQTSHSFASTSASVAMYAEHGLLDARLAHQDRFITCQRRRSPGSFSYLLNNTL